jgi:hypothetical protein
VRLLADENFPFTAVRALQEAGHDVVWMGTAAPGSSDLEVLARTAREGRVLLTFDKDFGELARDATLPSNCGVLLFRIPMPHPADLGQRLTHLVTARDDWTGHFSVIEPGRVRMRLLAQRTR